ncbi:hypothetical protein AB1286_24165 [Trinickia sp. NRRL B-1857]|uniref:hypothetical protein n=1 Tax=Trinickia sp. NRRL B-1857 TaxID=3162879 RepID=UPI003D2A54B7
MSLLLGVFFDAMGQTMLSTSIIKGSGLNFHIKTIASKCNPEARFIGERLSTVMGLAQA